MFITQIFVKSGTERVSKKNPTNVGILIRIYLYTYISLAVNIGSAVHHKISKTNQTSKDKLLSIFERYCVYGNNTEIFVPEFTRTRNKIFVSYKNCRRRGFARSFSGTYNCFQGSFYLCTKTL